MFMISKTIRISEENFLEMLHSVAGPSGRAVYGASGLVILELWDRGFESLSRHGCTRVYPKVSGLSR